MVSRAPGILRIQRTTALVLCTLAAAASVAFVTLVEWPTAANTCCDLHSHSHLTAAPARHNNYAPSKTLISLTRLMTTPALEEQHLRAIATAFRPRMSDGEKRDALRCLDALNRALRNANVTYFLYGRTLLGARRHRGIIPWDDDIDVLVNYTQLSDLERALRSITSYVLYPWHKNRYKFYARDGSPIPGKTWRWPYVDVCFFDENATHVYDNFPGLSSEFSYSKMDVFPLAYRPFDGLLLPSPANEERVLARNYDEQTCQSNQFSQSNQLSHHDESELRSSDVMSVPCTELYSMYPFIFRNSSKPAIDEILKVGDKIVGYFSNY